MKIVKILFWLFLSTLVVGDSLILYVLASATLPDSFPNVDGRVVNISLIVVLTALTVWSITGGWSWLVGNRYILWSEYGTPLTRFVGATVFIVFNIILWAALFDWI